MKVQGWRKFLAYILVIGVLSSVDAFNGPISSPTLNTIENISYAYFVGQAAVDFIKARNGGNK